MSNFSKLKLSITFQTERIIKYIVFVTFWFVEWISNKYYFQSRIWYENGARGGGEEVVGHEECRPLCCTRQVWQWTEWSYTQSQGWKNTTGFTEVSLFVKSRVNEMWGRLSLLTFKISPILLKIYKSFYFWLWKGLFKNLILIKQ